MLFEADLLPGYAWVFPLPEGRANVGFGVLRRPGMSGKELNARWRELLTRPSVRTVLGPTAEPEATHRAWPIPASFEYDALSDGRVLFVGDAAYVVDPLTGEGIAQAIETALVAVDAIATGKADGAGRRYTDGVRRALGRDLPFAAALAACAPLARGAALARARRRLDALDASPLRPLDVRGLSARAAPHAGPLAPRHVRRGGAYR